MRARIEEGVVYSPHPYSPLAHSMTFYDFLMERLAVHGSKTALICGVETLTYWELRDEIQHCAAGFRRKSIGKGDRVYVHIANSIESFVAVCGVLSTGATVVTSDVMWREDENIDRIERSSGTHILTDDSYGDMFARVIRRCNVKKAFIIGKRRSGFDSIHEFCGDDEALHEYEGLDSSGASFVEWTTGTTGLSKGAEIPQDRFLRKVSCLVGVEMLSAKDVLLGDCNISSYIAFFQWIVALHHGSTIAISRTCHTVPLDLFDVIKNVEAVTMISFPSRLRRILNFMKTSEDWDAILRRSLRKVFLTGSVTPPALAEEITGTFQLDDFRSCYGMSEAGGFLTFPPKEISGLNAGFPIPAVRMKIINEVSQEVLGPMERGEVLVDTPYAAAWYCGHSEAATDITDEQGWIHTGDLGCYDHYGRLFLCGRLKTMLVCQTRKVSPIEIEHCLLEHAAVEEVAVLGVPAPDGEEFPAAVVVTKRGHSQDQELANDLKHFVAERTPSFMHLHGGVYFADALRKNTRGKVWVTALRELLGTLSRMDSVDDSAPSECIY